MTSENKTYELSWRCSVYSEDTIGCYGYEEGYVGGWEISLASLYERIWCFYSLSMK